MARQWVHLVADQAATPLAGQSWGRLLVSGLHAAIPAALASALVQPWVATRCPAPRLQHRPTALVRRAWRVVLVL